MTPNLKGKNLSKYQRVAHEDVEILIAPSLPRCAESARERLLALMRISAFDGQRLSTGNACIVDLAVSASVLVAADLLDPSEAWTPEDRAAFQTWLAETIYPLVAWASAERRGTWGTAGSVAAAVIADYVANHPEPASQPFDPAAAFAEHNGLQLDRIGTTAPFDTRCDDDDEPFGVQTHGGIPTSSIAAGTVMTRS